MENNSSYSPESRYLLNFSFSQKRLSSKEDDYSVDSQAFSKSCMSSNVISETSLEEDHILLKRKSLLQRKSKGSLKIFYSEIIDLKLNKSNLSSLYSSIVIVYSKNGYTKHLIALSSSDGFAVRWFYDELVVRYSMVKSNLNKPDIIKSNEENYLEGNEDNSKGFDKLDDFMNQMNTEVSEKRKREISKQMKFDRCSSGEY
ncbi:hypothetical protein [Methanobrevibacter sp.]|uniref:hypothetical protein n=1 Tax=Methanobrevibacter sp. TaxID=66852 RepID=UPI0025E1306D|nr:hypothetical protein [Methanobrevibacter sp.]MBQ2961714.1 hypothetical protein [Methanobrevibacter sp.]